jgi:flagellar protein FlaG
MPLTEVSPQSITALDAMPATAQRSTVSTPRAVRSAVDVINQAGLLSANHQLSFSIDPATRKVVVRVVDPETREVVDQIPTEQVLQIAAAVYAPKPGDSLYA